MSIRKTVVWYFLFLSAGLPHLVINFDDMYSHSILLLVSLSIFPIAAEQTHKAVSSSSTNVSQLAKVGFISYFVGLSMPYFLIYVFPTPSLFFLVVFCVYGANLYIEMMNYYNTDIALFIGAIANGFGYIFWGLTLFCLRRNYLAYKHSFA